MHKVLVRTDGSASLGLGHVMRALALAHMLKPCFEILFFFLNPAKHIQAICLANGFSSVEVMKESDFFDRLTGREIVVIDGYQFDTSYQRAIKEKGCPLICIDDLHDKLFLSDLVINHAPGILDEDYRREKDTRLLLGTQYALLRPKFLAQAKNRRKIDRIEHLLICFGGADPKNLTCTVLNAVKGYHWFKKITVITGNQFHHESELQLIKNGMQNLQHFHSIGEADMISCFLEADLGVVPASGVLFEAIACKLPVVSGYYVSNQRNIYMGFKALGAFYDASDFSASSLRGAISAALEKDPNELLKRQGECIDGRSPDRLLREISSLLH